LRGDFAAFEFEDVSELSFIFGGGDSVDFRVAAEAHERFRRRSKRNVRNEASCVGLNLSRQGAKAQGKESVRNEASFASRGFWPPDLANSRPNTLGFPILFRFRRSEMPRARPNSGCQGRA
jgi:hypothetical protein